MSSYPTKTFGGIPRLFWNLEQHSCQNCMRFVHVLMKGGRFRPTSFSYSPKQVQIEQHIPEFPVHCQRKQIRPKIIIKNNNQNKWAQSGLGKNWIFAVQSNLAAVLGEPTSCSTGFPLTSKVHILVPHGMLYREEWVILKLFFEGVYCMAANSQQARFAHTSWNDLSLAVPLKGSKFR